MGMSDAEKVLVKELKRHLRIARACNYATWKMSFVDGVLNALCKVSGKEYGFSGQDVFVSGPDGERIPV